MNLAKKYGCKMSAPFFDLKDGSDYISPIRGSMGISIFVLLLTFTGIVIFFLGM
jgi:hypothetical protein